MSSLANNYKRKKLSFIKGSGSFLISTNGKKYLDFVQGIAVNSLGHSNNHLNKAIQKQSRKLWHVSGLNFDKKTLDILKRYNVPFVIQHTQGDPENMQKKPRYKNEILDIYDFFEEKIKLIRSIGIKHNNIIIDPGIGFGKNLKHNMSIIHNVSIFHSLGFPILVGNSRKRFIKELAKKNDSKSRVGGTLASSIYLMMQGVQILRIHDVNEIIQGLKIFKKIINN